MELSSLDRFFWVAGFAGHLVLLCALVWRRKILAFPCFSALIAFNVFRTAALYYEHVVHSGNYFTLYWKFVTVDTALQLLVFFEIARKVFRPLGRMSADVRRPLAGIAAVSVCLALLFAGLSAPQVHSADQRFVLRLALLSTLLMAEIFTGLTILSVTSGFVWTSQVGVIARGLGFYAVLALLVQGLQSYVGLTNGLLAFIRLSHLQICCYLACEAYWIAGALKRMPETRPVPAEMELQLAKIDGYMTSVLEGLRLGGTAS